MLMVVIFPYIEDHHVAPYTIFLSNGAIIMSDALRRKEIIERGDYNKQEALNQNK